MIRSTSPHLPPYQSLWTAKVVSTPASTPRRAAGSGMRINSFCGLMGKNGAGVDGGYRRLESRSSLPSLSSLGGSDRWETRGSATSSPVILSPHLLALLHNKFPPVAVGVSTSPLQVSPKSVHDPEISPRTPSSQADVPAGLPARRLSRSSTDVSRKLPSPKSRKWPSGVIESMLPDWGGADGCHLRSIFSTRPLRSTDVVEVGPTGGEQEGGGGKLDLSPRFRQSLSEVSHRPQVPPRIAARGHGGKPHDRLPNYAQFMAERGEGTDRAEEVAGAVGAVGVGGGVALRGVA